MSAAIARVRARWRLRSYAWTAAVAAAAFALVFIVTLASGGALALARVNAVVGAIVALIISTIRQRPPSAVEAANVIEASHDGLDNLIVTAAELDAHPRPVRADIRDEIVRQAADRLRSVDVARAVPLMQPIIVCVLALAGAGVFVLIEPQAPSLRAAVVGKEPEPSFTVRVTPPPYTRRPVEALDNPVQVTAIAGSRIRVETDGGRALREWTATESTGVEFQIDPGSVPKFLAVTVVPDAPPDIRVVTPGKDTAFAEPKGRVAVALQSSDDLGLAALSLRFTKASGGGENVTFTGGEVPLTIDRRGDQRWDARATIDLGSLDLADGDIVVYRAIARDTNPQGAPVQSEQYLIEIGRNAEIADAGFALPAEEKKYAISQQMVIYRTEQLIADQRKHQADWLEQNQTIAVEQRMVRAEVVFLGGGEVEDEVEEAAKSDELTEGRLQNTGRVEMLNAINAMSRAEAQLNEGRAEEALVFERQALASLERALDRRRFFLRTLPDRSRIDASRRLTGERRDARSWEREPVATTAPVSLDAQRQLMRELAAAPVVDARLAARVSAIDPSSPELQKAAVALASASTGDSRQAAVQLAMSALASHALRMLPAGSAIDLQIDPLAGRLASELAARPRR